MKTLADGKRIRSSANREPFPNSPEDILEKRMLAKLQSEFYSSRIPDDRFWWAVSRRISRLVLKEAKSLDRPPATLFLRLHYAFFDKTVQSVLMERHPEKSTYLRENLWYAVEAYLLAEQYALVAFDNNPLKQLNLIEGAAQFYFVSDLQWFSNLLASIANVFEEVLNALNPKRRNDVLMLQGWNNEYLEHQTIPAQWFTNSEFLNRLSSPTRKRQLASKRVTATKENTRRRKIFKSWQSSWEATFQKQNSLLNNKLKC